MSLEVALGLWGLMLGLGMGGAIGLGRYHNRLDRREWERLQRRRLRRARRALTSVLGPPGR